MNHILLPYVKKVYYITYQWSKPVSIKYTTALLFYIVNVSLIPVSVSCCGGSGMYFCVDLVPLWATVSWGPVLILLSSPLCLRQAFEDLSKLMEKVRHSFLMPCSFCRYNVTSWWPAFVHFSLRLKRWLSFPDPLPTKSKTNKGTSLRTRWGRRYSYSVKKCEDTL